LPTALIPNEKLARLLQSTLAHTKGIDSFDELPPVEIDGKLLLTGSLLNNIPVDVAHAWGADVVIVVDIDPYTRDAEDLNSVFGIVDQVGHLLQRRNSVSSLSLLRESDIVIRPAIGAANETDFSSLDERMALGVDAVVYGASAYRSRTTSRATVPTRLLRA